MVKGISVEPILEARFMLDGGAMFGVVPKPLWERTNPADERNRIELGARCMLIRHPEAGNILVDTGMGDKWDAKGRKIYNVRHEDTLGDGRPLGLEAGLAAAGLAVSDIDHVVLTHLHLDHAGGATRWANEERSAVEAVFAGKPHYVMAEQWSWAHSPSERDRGSFIKADFAWLEEDPQGSELHLLDGLTELFDGVTLIPRRGHTPGMACVKVDAEEATWIYLADLIPTAGHLKIPYVMGYDLAPVTTCREKREILSEASRHHWRLFFEHDPTTAWCHVEPDGRGAWRQVPSTNPETS